MQDFDFVDIQKICPSIQLDLIYATTNNLTKEVLYPLARCYLRRKVALKLAKVQGELEKLSLGLKIFDGYQPYSITKKCSELMSNVSFNKEGSNHNRGAAVDVTLIDFDGHELEMPTRIEEIDKRSHRDYDLLPKQVIANRQLLEDVMINGGFIPFEMQWWHFDDSEWKRYPVEDLCITELAQREKMCMS
jgi:D-alanyl-D-alanine dipeptidase